MTTLRIKHYQSEFENQKRPHLGSAVKIELWDGKIKEMSFGDRPQITNKAWPLLPCLRELLMGKMTLVDLWGLSFREVENFLRDENHLPAFLYPSSEYLEWEEAFLKIKMQILGAAQMALHSELSSELKAQFFARDYWQGLNLVAKNIWGQKLAGLLAMEFIYFDPKNLVLHLVCPQGVMAVESFPLPFLEVYLQSSLGLDLNQVEEFKVKLVAVRPPIGVPSL